MRLSTLVLAASASTILAAPRINIEAQQVILSCERQDDITLEASYSGDWMEDTDVWDMSTPDDMPSDEFHTNVEMAAYDDGMIDGIGWANGKQFIAHVDRSGDVMVKYYSAGWKPQSGFWNVGGKLARTISLYRIGETVFMAGVSEKGTLLLKYFRNERFYPSQDTWMYIDERCAGTPAMASHDGKTLSIAVRGNSGHLYHYTVNPDNDMHTDAVQIGNKKGQKYPTLVSMKSGTLQVLQYGHETMLQMATFDGKSWSNYTDVAKPWPRGSPTAIARAGRLDFFGVGPDNKIYTQSYDGKAWSGAKPLGRNVLNTVSALYYPDTDGADVYFHDTSTVKQGRYGRAGDVKSIYDMGGNLLAGPVAFSWGGARVDLWGIGMNGAVYQKAYDRNMGWTGWISFGGNAV